MSCLSMMCTEATDPLMSRYLAAAVRRYATPSRATNHASYRARLGLTISILASTTRPELATNLLRRVARDAIGSGDGYAARDVLGFRESFPGINDAQHVRLHRVATDSGLGLGELPESIFCSLTIAADQADKILDVALAPVG